MPVTIVQGYQPWSVCPSALMGRKADFPHGAARGACSMPAVPRQTEVKVRQVQGVASCVSIPYPTVTLSEFSLGISTEEQREEKS